MWFEKKEIKYFSWEKLVPTEVSGTIYFTQFRIQLFVPEAIFSAERDNSKMFLEKIQLTDSEIGNRPALLRLLAFGMNPACLYMNHSLGLNR